MIWIIASIPFWIAAAMLAVLGACALIFGIARSNRMPQPEFDRGMMGAFIVILAAGGLALIAAKICS